MLLEVWRVARITRRLQSRQKDMPTLYSVCFEHKSDAGTVSRLRQLEFAAQTAFEGGSIPNNFVSYMIYM